MNFFKSVFQFAIPAYGLASLLGDANTVVANAKAKAADKVFVANATADTATADAETAKQNTVTAQQQTATEAQVTQTQAATKWAIIAGVVIASIIAIVFLIKSLKN